MCIKELIHYLPVKVLVVVVLLSVSVLSHMSWTPPGHVYLCFNHHNKAACRPIVKKLDLEVRGTLSAPLCVG